MVALTNNTVAGKASAVLMLSVMLSFAAAGAASQTSLHMLFPGTNQLNHCMRTRIAVGTAAKGDDFAVSCVATAACETAWYIVSEKTPVPQDAGAYSLDFEIKSDADWMRSASDDTWGCDVLWFASDGSRIGRRIFTCYFLKGRDYVKFRFSGNIPSGAARAAVKFGTDAPDLKPGEEVHVRNTSLAFFPKGVQPPREIYPDNEPPFVRSVFKSPSPSPEVRYEITDDSGVDWNSVRVVEMPGREPRSFTREGDTIKVSPPASSWNPGPHWLAIDVKDVNGVSCTSRKAFLAGEPPAGTPRTSLRDDGVMLVDGKPFFPIGIYGVKLHEFNCWNFDRACADLKAGWFNFVHSYDSGRHNAFNAAATKYGLHTWTDAKFAPRCDSWFTATGRHERCVLAWYIGDDTYSNLRPWQLADRDEGVRMLDGTRITCQASGVMGGPRKKTHYEEYVNYSDVFMPELYHVLGRNARDDDNSVAMVVRDMKRTFKDIEMHGDGKTRAVWPILQFFDGVCWKRFPTRDELYATTYAALVHGGTGVTWFHYAGVRDEARGRRYSGVFRTRSDWCATTNLTRQIAVLAPVLLERTPPQPPVPEILSGPSADPFGQPAVTMLLKRHAGAVYIIAVNAAPKPVKARLFAPETAGTGDVMDENRKVVATAGSFTDDFKRFGVHIYRFGEGNWPAPPGPSTP